MSLVFKMLFRNQPSVTKRSILFFIPSSSVSRRECASKLNERVEVVEGEVDIEQKELEVEKLRDKSRLKPQHRNILFGKRPYSEPIRKHHITVKYNRKLYGKYGSESGVNPGIMWPTKEDLNNIKEYESVAYPISLQEMVVSARNEVNAKEEQIQQMQANVIEKLKKLQAWKDQLRYAIAKKEADALAAREKKAKMIEEVRRHFGFTVNPKDDRFQQLLAEKQKQQTKQDRQARLEEKEKKAIQRLMAKHETNLEEPKKPDGNLV